MPFSDLLGAAPVDLDAAVGRVRPEDLATLIYTSGTTGPPKGVMISHYNLCWVLESMNRATGEPLSGWRQVSYLPMAHIAERWLTHYLHIAEGTDVTTCPEPTELASYLREVRPEHFLGVPRVWEKIYGGIMAAVSADPEKKAGFERALEVGAKAAAVRVSGRRSRRSWPPPGSRSMPPPSPMSGPWSASTSCVSLSPARHRSPGRCSTSSWQIGVPMCEVYGMSEATGPITWARTVPARHRRHGDPRTGDRAPRRRRGLCPGRQHLLRVPQ